MCTLIRDSLFPDYEMKFPSNIEWQDVYVEMKAQTIAALPFRWLRDNPLPDRKLYADWMKTCDRQQYHWMRLMAAQTSLVILLEKHQIPFVIIKGAAAAIFYPDPHLRAAGDVDFLVRRCDYERTAALLEDSGYKLAHEKNPRGHHYGYTYGGFSFELHHRLAVIKEKDEKLLSLFEEGIMHCERQEIGNFQFPVLPPELNGLSLLFHINQHLRSGLGLRQIIDWMMYIDHLPEDIWKGQVLPMLRQTGMEKLALTVTAMCQKYFGLREIVEKDDSYPCEELMDYVLEKGNFGRKGGEEEGKIASVSLIASSPFRLLKRLQIGGMSRWKAAGRYRVLQPFAWIFQIGFITRELMRHHVSPRMFYRFNRKGVVQRRMIEKLGLRIDREIVENREKS